MKKLFYLLAFLIVQLSFAQINPYYFNVVGLNEGRNDTGTKDFTELLEDLDNGKPTVLITYNPNWCVPCIALIEDFHKKADFDKVNLITILVDSDDDSSDDAHGLWYKSHNYHANQDGDTQGFDSIFKTSSAPLVFIFDGKALTFTFPKYSMNLSEMVRFKKLPENVLKESWDTLNNAAWRIYLDDSSTVSDYERGLELVEKSYRYEQNYDNVDTKASLLYKLGRYTEALKEAKRAIDLAKVSETDYSTTSELINKIIEKM